MSSIERKVNLYKMFSEKNHLSKAISDSCIKNKLTEEKELIDDTESEFENQIKKIFQQKKFIINNQYDHNGVKSFLEEKDECLKKMELDDSILYKDLNLHKKNKNQKNHYGSQKNLRIAGINKITQIKNNNQYVIDSFISYKSRASIEKMLELLE